MNTTEPSADTSGPEMTSRIAQSLLQEAKITSVTPGQQAAAASVLENNPGFDMASHQVASLDADDESAQLLRSLQRIQNVSPDADSVQRLLDANFTSAAQIAALKPAEFAEAVPDLAPDTAQQIHSNATGVVHRNQMFLATVAPSMTAEAAPIRNALATTGSQPGLVNLDTLFHESVTTRCDNCNSVLSPAAYLVDLLEFLPADTVRAELLRRRPDLGDLDLSCANTNTELPYIDLVNEVLESYMASRTTKAFNNHEGDDSQQLIAEPRPLEEPVYKVYKWLSQQTTPIGTLPFDRSLLQTRVLLESLGTSRTAVLKTFGDGNEAAERAVAAETLGLPEAEYVALAGQSFALDDTSLLKQPHEYWGMASQAKMLHDYAGLAAVKDQFLPRTGLSYDELAELLASNFVRGHVPESLLSAPGRLQDLWSKVRWTEADRKAKWGELLAALDAQLDIDSPEADDAISAFSALPNMATVLPMAPSSWQPFAASGNPRWSLGGIVYYGKGPDPAESERIGTLDGTGVVKDDAGQATLYFDGDGVLRRSVHSPGSSDQSQDPEAYKAPPYDEAAGDKVFWIKNIPAEPPIATVPRIRMPDGTSASGQPTVIRLSAQLMQSSGPAAGADTAGWLLSPVPHDGEPDPAALRIRCLSGVPLSLDAWSRINRFVRVKKCLALTVTETDLVMTAFAADVGTPALPAKLAMLRTLQKYGLSLAAALAVLAGMTTPLYRTLFVKPSVVRAYPDLDLTRSGMPVFASGAQPPLLMDHAAGVGAALGISPADIATVLTAIKKPAGTEKLSLESLSAVYRHVLLCRVLNQPLAQLGSLLAVYDDQRRPLSDAETTMGFIDFWKTVLSRYKAAPSELEYLMLGTDPSGALSPPPSLVLQVAMAVHTVRAQPQDVQHIIQIYSAVFAKVPTDIIALLLGEASFETPTPPDPARIFRGYFVPPATGTYSFKGVTSLKDAPVPSRAASSAEQPPLMASLVGGQFYSIEGSDMRMSFRSSTSDTADQPIPEERLLLSASAAGTRDLMSLLARYSVLFGIANVPTADLEHLLNICRLPSPSATLSRESLRAMMAYDAVRASIPSLDAMSRILSRPPAAVSAVAADICAASGWDTSLVRGLLMRYTVSLTTPPALDQSSQAISAAKTAEGEVQAPEEETPKILKTSEEETLEKETPKMEAPEEPQVQVDINILHSLNEQYALCRRLGVANVTSVFQWASPYGDLLATAAQVRALARSRVDDRTWADTAGSLFDRIRSGSREALIAGCLSYLGTERVYDADGLFEYFLIDVNMGACLKTSRIKQAISSIQLFVQRCLLGLETSRGLSAANFTAADLAEWQWKSSIETWTANRKVFLYPENWLEPSLRDNKTDAFKAVEAALLDGKSTYGDLVSRYVAEMLETADLEPMNLYEGAGARRNHIIARTRMAPHQFFYRAYDKVTDVWTPWEKLAVDIPTVQVLRTLQRPVDISEVLHPTPNLPANEINQWDPYFSGRVGSQVEEQMRKFPNAALASGSYVYPVALNGEGDDDRICLFLPILQERSHKLVDNSSDASEGARKFYYWELSMAFTEKKDGKWSSKQTAVETLSTLAGNTYGAFPNSPVSGAYKQDCMGIGVRDIDEHLANQGSFFFFTFRESDGTVGIRVHLGSAMRTVTGTPGHGDYKSQPEFYAYWLGDFVLRDGHCHLRSTRTKPDVDPDTKPGGTDVPFDSFPLVGEWLFQGRTWADGGLQARKVMYMPRAQSAASYVTPYTAEYLPKNTTSDAFAKRTVVLTTRRPANNSALLVSLSNDLASPLTALAASGRYGDVFRLLDPDGSGTAWPGAPRVRSVDKSGKMADPPPDGNKTTVLHQALGRVDCEVSYFWYHEQHTPVALDCWELGMHLPMLLADSYSGSQQFDAALDAIKLVFDPTVADKTRAWRFFPFRELANRPSQTPGGLGDVAEWEANPFSPFVVARGRHVAYMKWFVYKYIEVMAAKGDAYFRRFTLESINLAIQCYVEAAHVFGPPVQSIASVGKREAQTYNAVVAQAKQSRTKGWDAADLNNVLVNMETLFPFRSEAAHPSPFGAAAVNIFGTATAKYFCVPANPALASLRALIDDRLYKIRHCRDIDGNVRSIALWEPPLDPGALVAAVARGTPIGSVVDAARGALPNCRFAFLIRHALELCADVRSLGSTILGLRERRDAEMLASLRLEQQRAVGKRLRDLRQAELDEATKTLEYYQGNRTAAVNRMQYYLDLLGEDRSLVPKEGASFDELRYAVRPVRRDYGFPLSQFEAAEVRAALEANDFSLAAGIADTVSAFLAAIPTLTSNLEPGGVGESISYGGNEASAIARGVGSALHLKADILRWRSDNAGRRAMFERQTHDRLLAANSAGQEITGIDVQIAAQKLRIDQAARRLALEELALDQDDEIDAFLRAKYTSAELFAWSLNTLQGTYYTLYNLALDAAAAAERAFNFERGKGLAEQEFVTGGYWNASRDGLYAGEQLGLALRRLQKEHMATRGHDYELSRSVSLRQVAPLALARLRREGSTGEFELPEALWDMDFPGHCKRRIRSVSLAVPCVVGAYTPVNATLALTANSFRAMDGSLMSVDGLALPIASAAISSAANDAGVFELNFHDERYMPFEGAGVASKWTLKLDSVVPAFSYSSIADVVLHIRYTADRPSRDLTADATARVNALLRAASDQSSDFADGLCLYLDARAEFATAWAAFRATGTLRLQGLNQRLPFFARGGTVTPVRVKLAVEYDAGGSAAGRTLLLTIGDGTGQQAKDIPFSLPSGQGTSKVSVIVDQDLAAGTAQSTRTDLGVTWGVGSEAADWALNFKDGSASDRIAAAKAIVSMQVLISFTLATGTSNLVA